MIMVGEPKKLRATAIKKLESAVYVGEERLLVGKTRVPRNEIDELLQQLKKGDAYLKVPMSLYFSDVFWRELKLSSNQMVNSIKEEER